MEVFKVLDWLSVSAIILAIISMILLGSAALFALVYMFVGREPSTE